MRTKGEEQQVTRSLWRIALSVVAWTMVGIAVFFVANAISSGLAWLLRILGGGQYLQMATTDYIYRIVIYLVMASLLGGAIVYRTRSQIVRIAGLTRMLTWKDLMMALAGLVVYFLAAMGALFVASQIPGFPLNQAQDVGSTQLYGMNRFVAFVTLVMLTPFFEELIFRGMLYGKLRRYAMPWWLPAILVSALFGLAHMQWNVAIDVFCLSMVSCALRELTGSIWSGVVLHVSKNFFAFMMLYVFSNSISGSS